MKQGNLGKAGIFSLLKQKPLHRRQIVIKWNEIGRTGGSIMLKQRLFAALLASSLCVSSAWAAEATFADVTPDSLPWAYEAVEAFADKGIIDGVGNGLFQPKAPVTREQFAKMLSLTFALETADATASADPATNPADNTPVFRDVTPDTLSADSIRYIQSVQPYFPGYSNTDGSSFLPQQVATREEITTACVRVLSEKAASTGVSAGVSSNTINTLEETFSDSAAISEERRLDVAAALGMGLIEGFEDGTFRPQAGVNRAQAVVILSRALTIAQQQADQTESIEQAESKPEPEPNPESEPESKPESETESKPKPEPEPEPAEEPKPSSSGSHKPTTSPSDSADVREIGEFYGYVLNDPYRTSVDGQQLSAVTLWTGEEEMDIRLEGTLPSFRAGAVLRYTRMSDGSLRHVGAVRGQVGALLEYSDRQDKVAILTEENGLVEYEITEDSLILYVDSEERTGEYGSFQKAQPTETGYINNVWFFAYGDEIECLVVDVNNELR